MEEVTDMSVSCSLEAGCAIQNKLKEGIIGLQGSSGNRNFHYYNSDNHNQTYRLKQKNTTNIYNHMEKMGTGIRPSMEMRKVSSMPLNSVFALCCFDSTAYGGYECMISSNGITIPLKEIIALNCNPQSQEIQTFDSGLYEISAHVYLKEKTEVGIRLLINSFNYGGEISPENPINTIDYDAYRWLNKYDTIGIQLYSLEEKNITLREDIGISLFINKISD